MTRPTSFRKAILAGAAAAVALVGVLAPAFASAQPAPPPGYYDGPPPNDYDYDACQNAKSGNTAAGAIIGGTLGAIVGAGVAGHGNRGAGALVGAGVGGVSGAAIGSSGVDCNAPPPPPPPPGYQGSGYDGPPPGYDGGPPPGYNGPPPDYGQGYYQGGGYYDGGPGPGYYGQGDQDEQDDQGDCMWTRSPVQMPDGSVRYHRVEVCRDQYGRYQPVE